MLAAQIRHLLRKVPISTVRKMIDEIDEIDEIDTKLKVCNPSTRTWYTLYGTTGWSLESSFLKMNI